MMVCDSTSYLHAAHMASPWSTSTLQRQAMQQPAMVHTPNELVTCAYWLAVGVYALTSRKPKVGAHNTMPSS